MTAPLRLRDGSGTVGRMRLAVFQCPAIRDDAAGATRHALDALAAAGGDAIDLALFPEAFLLGHGYDPGVIATRAYGCSAIVSPAGTIVARVPEEATGSACYDITPP